MNPDEIRKTETENIASLQCEISAQSPISLKELKKHLNLIFDALSALGPSRNYISQFLMAIPEEYGVIYEGFPEFLHDRLLREKWAKILGLVLGPRIEFHANSLGKKMKNLIESMMELFEESAFTDDINVFLADIRQDPLPHPSQEWTKNKIQMIFSEPIYGNQIRQIISAFSPNTMPTLNMTLPHPTSFSEIKEKTQISAEVLNMLLCGLTGSMKIIQRIDSQTPTSPDKNEINPNQEEFFQLSSAIKWEWIKDLL